ncbi:hypothetical protein D3C86_1860640 [compost metagenome]
MTKEAVGIIQRIDFVKEFSKFAETHKFKITAEIDIIKKDKTPDDSGATSNNGTNSKV